MGCVIEQKVFRCVIPTPKRSIVRKSLHDFDSAYNCALHVSCHTHVKEATPTSFTAWFYRAGYSGARRTSQL